MNSGRTLGVILALIVGLAGCAGPSGEPVDWNAVEAEIQAIRSETPTAVTPEQAGEVFALGGDATDVQRDLLKQELVGAVLEWDITVYDVDYEDGLYRVISQPLPGAGPEAVPLVRVVAFVRAQGEADDERLKTVKTDESIRIRGRVRDVTLRTALEVWPAVVMQSSPDSGLNRESL